MKIIFLDIDGVLNSGANMIRNYEMGNSTSSTSIKLDEACIDLLKYIVDKTGAEIVLSSSWRISGTKSKTIKNLTDQLNAKGMHILDYTPILHHANKCRGDEIQLWIERYETLINRSVEAFVILDDDSDMGLFLNRLVKCNHDIGLTEEGAHKAIDILNEEGLL